MVFTVCLDSWKTSLRLSWLWAVGQRQLSDSVNSCLQLCLCIKTQPSLKYAEKTQRKQLALFQLTQEILILNTPAQEKCETAATAAFNPAAACSTDCLYRETDLPWKSPRHLLLLPVTCSLQFYNSFCKSLEDFQTITLRAKQRFLWVWTPPRYSSWQMRLIIAHTSLATLSIFCYSSSPPLKTLHSASVFSYVKPVYCNHFQNSGISSARKVVQRTSKPHDISESYTWIVIFIFKTAQKICQLIQPNLCIILLDLTAKYGSL